MDQPCITKCVREGDAVVVQIIKDPIGDKGARLSANVTLPGRLVVSAGRLSGRGFAHLNGPSGTVTFDRPGAGIASRAWIEAGPAHHLALVRGDRREELRAAAAILGLDLVDAGVMRHDPEEA